MIIYNITSQVSWPVHEAWTKWLREEYVAAVLTSGVFLRYQLVRLLEVDESCGPTYALQLYAQDEHHNSMACDQLVGSLERTVQQRWGDDVVSFASVMQVIE